MRRGPSIVTLRVEQVRTHFTSHPKEITVNTFKKLALPLFAAALCFGASAREASEAPRGQDNGRHGGKAIDVTEQLLAREAGEAPRGQDNNQQKGKGGKAIDTPEQLLAR